MPQHLPLAQLRPVRLAPIRDSRLPKPEPRPVVPVLPANVPLRVREVDDHDRETRYRNGRDGEELGHDEEVVEARAGPGAERVREGYENEDEDRERLVRGRRRLVGHAGGGVDALDEDDAKDGERGGHDGHDPRPGSEEAEHVTENVLEIRLDAAYAINCQPAKATKWGPKPSQAPAGHEQPTFSRDRGSQLGKRARARPGEDAAQQPDDEGQAGGGHVRVDGAGRGEDAAADHDADDDPKGLQRSEVAGKGAPLGAGLLH